MPAGNNATFSVEVVGIPQMIKKFQGLELSLRRNANGELRSASQQIANQALPLLGGGGGKQEAAVLAAAGGKRDRYVVIQVPRTVPQLSGMTKKRSMKSRYRKARAARRAAGGTSVPKTLIGFALENGSPYPQFRSVRRGGMIADNIVQITRFALPRYTFEVSQIMRKYGLI